MINNNNFIGKVIIFSAPSGAGKTTIVQNLLKSNIPLSFSVSACSRPKRKEEINGKDYHFLTKEEFNIKIKENAFVEWEQVYESQFYGTLKSEIKRIWKQHHHVVFDVDVLGGVSLKKHFGDNAISIFIEPPSMEILFKRLKNRQTENAKSLAKRIEKADKEMEFKDKFDIVVTNDDLSITLKEIKTIVHEFIK